MPQQHLPSSLNVPQQGTKSQRSARLAFGLVVLAGADIVLMARLGTAIGAMLTQPGPMLTPILAVAGSALMVSAALLLTWLSFDDLAQGHRGDAMY